MVRVTIKIAEIFYSIQGEIDVGMPAIFIRLSGCNLIQDKNGCNFCDSKFAEKGKHLSIKSILKEIAKYNCKNIVITGGESLIQLRGLRLLVSQLNDEGYNLSLETNGTIYDNMIIVYFSKINCSPKKQAIFEEVLMRYATEENARFKFVYESKKDKWWENIIDRVGIPYDRVWIMPEGKTREEQLNKSNEVIEYCKYQGYNFSPRLHTLVWDKKRGV